MKSVRSTGMTVALACGLALLPSVVRAQNFFAVMNGNTEVPAVNTTAFGFATISIVGNSLTVHMTWSGLIGGNPSAAHIHCCALPGANAPVVIPFTGFPTTTSGVYDNTFTNVSQANIDGIKGGLAYTNIHNASFPGGEIRGLIVAAPEPATFAFMASGLLALGVIAKRRKNSRK